MINLCIEKLNYLLKFIASSNTCFIYSDVTLYLKIKDKGADNEKFVTYSEQVH